MFDRDELPEEVDVADPDHVALIKARCDPELWHNAVMAALAYRGDRHGLVQWVLEQPELDRSTAGWIFLWGEGTRYLAGETSFAGDWLTDANAPKIFDAVCQRSEQRGFGQDVLGLDREFEAVRQAAVRAEIEGRTAPGFRFPQVLLSRPFPPPKQDGRYFLEDGIIFPVESDQG